MYLNPVIWLYSMEIVLPADRYVTHAIILLPYLCSSTYYVLLIFSFSHDFALCIQIVVCLFIDSYILHYISWNKLCTEIFLIKIIKLWKLFLWKHKWEISVLIRSLSSMGYYLYTLSVEQFDFAMVYKVIKILHFCSSF